MHDPEITLDLISKEQVMDCESRLLEAIKKSDLPTLDELLHGDLLFNSASGETVTKAMDMEVHRSGKVTVHEMSASEHMISLIGDTAVVTLTVQTKGSYLDSAFDGKLRYVRVWKLFNDKLKVIAGSFIQV
jgi:ketosteroid isomerase-like protein